MRKIFLILSLFIFSCDEEANYCYGDGVEDECGVCNGDNSTCSIYDIWRSTEGQYCEYANNECINCYDSLGDSPFDGNPDVIDDYIIFDFSEDIGSMTRCWTIINMNQETCTDLQDSTWEEDNSYCNICYQSDTPITINEESNQLCMLWHNDCSDFVCFDFLLSEDGNSMSFNASVDAECVDENGCILDTYINSEDCIENNYSWVDGYCLNGIGIRQ